MNVFLIIIDDSKNLLVFEIFESMFFPQFSRRLFSFWCWVSSVPSCPVSALIGKSPSNRSFSSYLVSLFQNESPFMWKWVWFAPRRSFFVRESPSSILPSLHSLKPFKSLFIFVCEISSRRLLIREPHSKFSAWRSLLQMQLIFLSDFLHYFWTRLLTI